MYKLLLHLPCGNHKSLNLKLLYETIPNVADGWWFPSFFEDSGGKSVLDYESMTVTMISHQPGCVVVGIDDESQDESWDYDQILLGNVGWFPEVDNLKADWEESTPPWKTLTEITGRESSIVA